ncbi:MAG: hypothetical protein V4542_01690 [Pseudomonadota bacterium]
MRKAEQAVARAFTEHLRIKATSLGSLFQACPLDGGDRNVLADYLISDHDNFSLIEFKSTQSEIKTEAKKQRVHSLCAALESNPSMRDLHDLCHFIAWKDRSSKQVTVNVYRHEVCNQATLGNTCVVALTAGGAREFTGTFGQGFCRPPPRRSITFAEFKVYLDWLLLVTTQGTVTNLAFATHSITTDTVTLAEFASLDAGYNWLQTHRPRAAYQP